MQEVSLEHVKLGLGPGAQGPGIFNFFLSRGPRLHVTITGISLKLAAAAPLVSLEEVDDEDSSTSTAIPVASPGPVREDGTKLPLYLLQMIILELHNISIVDEVRSSTLN